MNKFVIRVLTGDMKGKVFPISDGLKIGRTTGDILLSDQAVSDLHAEIKVYDDGQIFIVDRDSKNKIFVNNKKVIKSILEKGSQFTIGKTQFELFTIHPSVEKISSFMKQNIEKAQDLPLAVKPFYKAIKLTFLTGFQKGQSYSLFYGPRFFGLGLVDIPILESKLPEDAFAFIPEKTATFFVTNHPKQIRLNKQKIKKAKIKNKDKITIGNTHLQLHL